MPRPLPLLLLILSAGYAAAEVPVTVRPLSELSFHPERSAPASVLSINDADLSAQISAQVQAILVRVGQVVEAGSVLVELDCRDYQSQLAAQQATLNQLQSEQKFADSQLGRARNLNRDRNISEEEVDRRDSVLAALDARVTAQQELVRQAEINVERCTITAPYRAAVTARLANVGALADPGSPLVHLVQLDELEVSARVRPDEAAEGAEAERVDLLYLGKHYPLKVARVAPVVDPATRTIEVRLSFTSEAAPSGASGRLVWRSAGTYLPPEIPVRRDGELGVFLFQDGKAAFNPLPRALEGQPAHIDLPGDRLIVVEGRHRLQDGDPVRPAEPE